MVAKHLLIWQKAAQLSIQSIFANRTSTLFFTLGKLMRFSFFIIFLLLIYQRVDQVKSFTLDQMIIFFLTFNLVDLFGQIFFRGIYWFRSQVVSGEFDFALVQPVNPLFRILTQHTDILDVPLFLATAIYLGSKIATLPIFSIFTFFISLLSGFIIITGIHIIVASLGVITTEVAHTIMVFRDISSMARVPVDIYIDSIRALLTFVIPLAVAFTFPAKALLGLLNPTVIAISFLSSIIFLFASYRLWRFALTKYSSASS